MSDTSQLKARMAKLATIRKRFNESLAIPLRQAVSRPNPLISAQAVWQLPVEAASSGFRLTMVQTTAGWFVEIYRVVDRDTAIHAAGQASSLLPALVQITEAVLSLLDELEYDCRHALIEMDAAALAA